MKGINASTIAPVGRPIERLRRLPPSINVLAHVFSWARQRLDRPADAARVLYLVPLLPLVWVGTLRLDDGARQPGVPAALGRVSAHDSRAALTPPPGDGPGQPRRMMSRRPAPFETNRGQFGPGVDFVQRGEDHALLLSPTEIVFQPARRRGGGAGISAAGGDRPLRLRFAGAAEGAVPAGVGPAQATISYLRGNDPRRWVRRAPAYGRVAYRGLYPGIDIVYYGVGGDLEFDLHVAPGAAVAPIALRFDGADSVRLGRDGEIIAASAGREIRLHVPRAYQDRAAGRQVVAARYALAPDGTVRLRLGEHDASLPLVIDPVLAGFSVLGGSRADESFSIALDPAGNIYIAGRTTSPDLPASGGLANDLDTQAFVAKLDPTGEALLWATYLGGEAEDVAFGIAVDAAGAAHVVGKTQSSDFPTTANAFQPSCAGSGFSPESCVAAFLAQLGPDGDALAYSTFLFGAFNADSGTAGFDEAQGVGLDPSGAVYVAGSTASKRFPVTAGALQAELAGPRDGFVVKFDLARSGRDSLRWATYLGGSFDPGAGSYGVDTPYAIAVDAQGSAIVAGSTDSADFPTVNAVQAVYGGGQDGFVAKLDPGGARLVYSSFLGGAATDTATGVAVDPHGHAYVTGQTKSENFPIRNPLQGMNPLTSATGDAFVSQLTGDGRDLVYSTYLGSPSFDYGTGIAADGGGNAYVVGYTDSDGFPEVAPLPPFGAPAAFIAKIAPGGTALRYSSRLPGWLEAGGDVAVDAWGNAYVTGPTVVANIDAEVLKLVCPGDCDGHASVTVDEIVGGVNIALDLAPARACAAFDRNRDGRVTIDELLLAVSRALGGCL